MKARSTFHAAVALFPFLTAFVVGGSLALGEVTDSEAAEKKPKEVAGKADVLRHVKKHFAAFRGWEKDTGRIRLVIEGEGEKGSVSSWPALADAEVKIHGWWGRIEQLRDGDRVWVWFLVDRKKKPVSVLMVADEFSEQDIHDDPHRIDAVEGDTVTVSIPAAGDKLPARKLAVAGTGLELKAGENCYLQTAERGIIREAVEEADFPQLRGAQQDWLRARWREKGLPGTIVFLHPLGGEMEIMLDHEAMRWGRYLENGDSVSIRLGDSRSKAQVKFVEPWRERTRIRLVTNSGLDQVGWSPGQRIGLLVPEPPAEVQSATLPTDIGRIQDKTERVEWFLQSILYCTCGIARDRCTGMFYTLGSCNVNACGGPNHWRGMLADQIDAGLNDREIFEEFRQSHGRDFWRPHLLR